MNHSDFRLPRSLAIGTILEFYRRHSAELPDSLKKELHAIDVLRQQHLETILGFEIGMGSHPLLPRERHCYGLMLEMMVPYSDLLCIHPELRSGMRSDSIRFRRVANGTYSIRSLRDCDRSCENVQQQSR